MMHVTGERTLEKYKFFPYVAWTIVIGFSFFVYSMTMNLKEVTANFTQSSTNLETVTSELVKIQKDNSQETTAQ